MNKTYLVLTIVAVVMFMTAAVTGNGAFGWLGLALVGLLKIIYKYFNVDSGEAVTAKIRLKSR